MHVASAAVSSIRKRETEAYASDRRERERMRELWTYKQVFCETFFQHRPHVEVTSMEKRLESLVQLTTKLQIVKM